MRAVHYFLGNEYFKRFSKNSDGSKVLFWTSKRVNEYMEEMQDVSKWMAKLKYYVKAIEEDLIADKKLVFVIESQIFLTYTEPAREISVMVGIFFYIQM